MSASEDFLAEMMGPRMEVAHGVVAALVEMSLEPRVVAGYTSEAVRMISWFQVAQAMTDEELRLNFAAALEQLRSGQLTNG